MRKVLITMCLAGLVGCSKEAASTAPSPVETIVAPTPLWTRSGVGEDSFDLPTFVKRISVSASNTGFCSYFSVKISGYLIVSSDYLGTCFNVNHPTTYSGTFAVTGGPTEVYGNGIVIWSLTEVR